MTAFYNEHDPFMAEWLRELISMGLIAPGVVDERSIEDIAPAELAGFTQVHLFAGLGGWSYALRQAGWPDDRPVWTGSCPCQPFSAAGKGAGFSDPRHLWPDFFRLIESHRPVAVFGEQVASKDGLAWLDLVAADLEGAGYSFGAVDTCAAGFGAPHIRQRLYWVADSGNSGRELVTHGERGDGARVGAGGPRIKPRDDGADARRLADALRDGAEHGSRCCVGQEAETDRTDRSIQGERLRPGIEGTSGGLADAQGCGHGEHQRDRGAVGGQKGGCESQEPEAWGLAQTARNRREACGLAESAPEGQPHGGRRPAQPIPAEVGGGDCPSRPRPTDGQWRDADWLLCRDGKWRPAIPSFVALVDGLAVDMVPRGNYSTGKGKDEKEEVANASCTQGNTEQAVRVLRTDTDQEADGKAPGGLRGLHAEEVLRQGVHGEGNGKVPMCPEAVQGKGAPNGEESVRNLWQEYFAACPPQERGCFRQHSVELDDIVRQLPQALAFAELHGDRNTEAALLVLHKRIIQESNVQHALEQTPEVWASLGEEEKGRLRVGVDVRDWRRMEFFPLEHGAASRVGRLRGYGNAIVAPQAEEFVRAFLEITKNT